MKKISLGVAQNVKEVEFILENKKVYDEITWIPLNLETLLFFKLKRLKYLPLKKVLNNEFHKTGIVSVEKILNKIGKKIKFEFFLKKRYLGAIRKYLNSIYFIIKIFEYVEKNFIIKKIYISGWNGKNLKDIKSHYILSEIVNELYKQKFKIISLYKPKKIIDHIEKKMVLPLKFKKEYILINNIGYNFFTFIKKYYLFKRILVIESKNISFLKKIFFKCFNINFIKKENLFKKSERNLSIPEISIKFKKYNLIKLISIINKELKIELLSLLGEKFFFKQLFKKNKPSKIILNNTRGSNEFLSKLSREFKTPCYIASHGTLSKSNNKYSKIYNKIISEEVTSRDSINCIQSKIAYHFFKKNFNKKNYKITGNLIFTETIRKKNSFFLYAVTTRDFLNMQYYGIETFYEFFNNLEELEKISNEMNIKICVKPHPIIQDQIPYLKKYFNKLEFSEKKLSLLLRSSITTISFSSTVIEDSLQSSVPVILFDKSNRYNHCNISKNSVNDKSCAVHHATDVIKLKNCIKLCLKRKKINFSKFIFDKKIKKNIPL
tara:strand:+ start:5871 stop:7517 length:1647 start_codon:yes stop_codon:yes gene_type:complete